jgi:hypothetical protein
VDRLQIRYDEVITAERHPGRRIGPCNALRLDCLNCGTLLIASIGGVGILGEIFATLRTALSARSEAPASGPMRRTA